MALVRASVRASDVRRRRREVLGRLGVDGGDDCVVDVNTQRGSVGGHCGESKTAVGGSFHNVALRRMPRDVVSISMCLPLQDPSRPRSCNCSQRRQRPCSRRHPTCRIRLALKLPFSMPSVVAQSSRVPTKLRLSNAVNGIASVLAVCHHVHRVTFYEIPTAHSPNNIALSKADTTILALRLLVLT